MFIKFGQKLFVFSLCYSIVVELLASSKSVRAFSKLLIISKLVFELITSITTARLRQRTSTKKQKMEFFGRKIGESQPVFLHNLAKVKALSNCFWAMRLKCLTSTFLKEL